MITPEHAHLLFQYNQWANRRALDACAALTPEQSKRDLGASFKSVHNTLAHIYGAEWAWLERFFGRSPSRLPAGETFPDLAAVRAKLGEMDQEYLEYVSKLTTADLERVFEYKNLAGTELASPLWQMLQHITNHGTYHRGQIVTMLRQLGAQPITTDMIGFFREQSSDARA